ncbi:MAG TPA: DUF3810 domain-containing protein [Bacillota bacterium]|nr:DUF3810 domain-containing protein [Bacillota bacterium]
MHTRFLSVLSHRKSTIFVSACLLASFCLILLSRTAGGFAQWYAVNVYPVFPNLIGRLSSLWDHSFFEAGILLFIVMAAALILSGIAAVAFIRNSSGKAYGSFCLRFLSCVIAALMLVYSLTCAVNYQRDRIGAVLKLPETDLTEERLEALCTLLAEDMTALTEEPEWDYGRLSVNDTDYIEAEAVNSMQELGRKEPSLSGYYPEPKPAYFSNLLSRFGIEGIFSPFTLEANYNENMPTFLIPYTLCHELAHLKGYMREDDAGFIAYLACRNSPSPVFQYSGIFSALKFALGALKSEASPEEFNKIYQSIPEPARIQLGTVQEQSAQGASSFMAVTKSVNDLYLKANAQTGTKSYGGVVDLLIEDYAGRIDKADLI